MSCIWCRILVTALPALFVASASAACDFGDAIFRRADGATLAVKDRDDDLRWFEATGLEGVAGFHAMAVNCIRVEAPCVVILPVDTNGQAVEGGGGGESITSEGRDAWPGDGD